MREEKKFSILNFINLQKSFISRKLFKKKNYLLLGESIAIADYFPLGINSSQHEILKKQFCFMTFVTTRARYCY
jgi:hypothetical protein